MDTELHSRLHENQGGLARHKSVEDAYKDGYKTGSNAKASNLKRSSWVQEGGAYEQCSEGSMAPVSRIAEWEDNQTSPGRHLCAICAYREGFKAGVRMTVARQRNGPGRDF